MIKGVECGSLLGIEYIFESFVISDGESAQNFLAQFLYGNLVVRTAHYQLTQYYFLDVSCFNKFLVDARNLYILFAKILHLRLDERLLPMENFPLFLHDDDGSYQQDNYDAQEDETDSEPHLLFLSDCIEIFVYLRIAECYLGIAVT